MLLFDFRGAEIGAKIIIVSERGKSNGLIFLRDDTLFVFMSQHTIRHKVGFCILHL